jgi:hypothetical protein
VPLLKLDVAQLWHFIRQWILTVRGRIEQTQLPPTRLESFSFDDRLPFASDNAARGIVAVLNVPRKFLCVIIVVANNPFT